MKIREVTREEIDGFAAFAKEVFIDYYTDLIGPSQAAYMAELFLSAEAILDLRDKGAHFKTIIHEGYYAGFCEYIREDDRVFLSKLYVRKDLRGKGLGKMLFEDCRSFAVNEGLKSIYLTVNKYNTPSYDIYRHLGFKKIEAVVNDIGQGYVMDDYIMEYDL